MSARIGAWLIVWCGPRDHPGVRTSHRAPTATSGGVAVLAATSVAFALSASQVAPHGGVRPTLVVLGASLLIGAIGAADDVVDLGARTKLLLGVALALLVGAALPPVAALPLASGLRLPLAHPVAVAGAALWIVTAANAVNFIDGADGLAPGAMVVAFAGLALAAWSVGDIAVGAASLLVATALAGFLPSNVSGRLFLGDAGSLFLGFLFASLHLAAATRHDGPRLALYFGPLALLPILADVLLTLAHRARSREPLLQAHRRHLYQRWLAATGRSHIALAARVWVLMLAACGLAGLAQALPAVQGPVLALAAILATAAWLWTGRRLGEVRPPG